MKKSILLLMGALTFTVGAQENVKPSIAPRVVKPEVRAKVDALSKAIDLKKPERKGGDVVPPPPHSSRRSSSKSGNKDVTRSNPNVPLKMRRTATRRPTLPSGLRPSKVEASSARPGGLTENVTIHVAGNIYDGSPLYLSLTGAGPLFNAKLVTGSDNTPVEHTYTVTPQGEGYRVEYQIGMRIALKAATYDTPSGKKMANVQYRNVAISGAVILKEGKAVAISDNGDSKLSLTLSKPVAE